MLPETQTLMVCGREGEKSVRIGRGRRRKKASTYTRDGREDRPKQPIAQRRDIRDNDVLKEEETSDSEDVDRVTDGVGVNCSGRRVSDGRVEEGSKGTSEAMEEERQRRTHCWERQKR
jgi:hypothetical protein